MRVLLGTLLIATVVIALAIGIELVMFLAPFIQDMPQ